MPRKLLARRHLLAAAASLALAFSSTAAAQGDGRVQLRGRLVDRETGEPVRAGRIDLPRRRITVYSGADGRFALPPLRPGEYDVDITELGYMQLRLRVRLVRDDSLDFRMTPDPVMLQELVVFAKRMDDNATRSTTSTRSFSREQMSVFGAGSTLAFLELNGGVRPVPCGGLDLRFQCSVVRGGPEPVAVWIDGLPAFAGLDDLRTLPVQDVFHVNVYRGGSTVEVITEKHARSEAHRQLLHPLGARGSQPGVRWQGTIQGREP